MSARSLPAIVLALCASFVLASCSGSGSSAHDSETAPALPTPLATSLPTAAGTWATVPMGHLGQPLNTFWQLLFRPAVGGPWSNHIEATAVATNGGLVLGSPRGAALIAGIRPSNLLTFSPLIYTSSAGRSWSNGLLPRGLAARPDALAADSLTQALALVEGATGAQVLASAGNLSAWRTAVTQRQLAGTSAGRACGLSALTAVAYLGGSPLVGASCGRPGVAGLFLQRAGRWQLLGGALPAALARARVEVLALERADGGIGALLDVSGTVAQSGLIAAWYAGGRWSGSAPLPVGLSERVASVGPTGSDGMFALLTSASRPARLALASGPGAGWRQLPSPPAGTATVAFDPSAGAEALAVQGSTLDVWTLDRGTRAWARRQSLKVDVEYGSSE
ncbi:MAG TPA: hypothetical protein VMB51_10140 [Solirubrobacteraceae bacterium]|nr:hypothetical protein [Solirubrobacteraceae bacterium]